MDAVLGDTDQSIAQAQHEERLGQTRNEAHDPLRQPASQITSRPMHSRMRSKLVLHIRQGFVLCFITHLI